MPNTQKRQESAADFAIATPPGNLPETVSAEVSATEMREALSKAITPVTILATDGPGGRAGVTCSAVCSVCDTPPTVLVCVNRNSFANGVIKANGILTVNWLSADQSELSQLFAGVGGLSMPERFARSQWGILASGAPYCKEAMMTLDCRVADAIEVGTHSLIFARVIATTKAEERDPLAYYQRAYATTRPATL
jgi:flavin reductase (NADH)/flavin reductase/chlorophenol-4-monooxygenase component 1